MAVTAQLVKELREKSGAGMMDCKTALEESKGNLDGALEYLRKKGLQALSKKTDRIASEGIVATYITENQKTAVVVEVNSETDFVAKNDDFINFSNQLASLIATKKPADITQLSSLSLNGKTIDENLNDLVARIGEKMTIRRFKIIEAKANEKLANYIHMGNKIAVVVKVDADVQTDLIRDIAMHIAAVNPRFLNAQDIPEEVKEKEKEIYKEQLKQEGKPENIIDKILAGKMSKFASEVCLNEQVFVKDPTGKKKVSQIVGENKKDAKVVEFIRYQVGEGLQKKEDDFASEVAKMAQ